MDEDILKKVIEAGNAAPSGGNSQPWRFFISGNLLTLKTYPEKDHPVFNYRGRGTLIAHGAALENISIAATAHGFTATFTHNLNAAQPETAVVFTKNATAPANEDRALYEAIANRHTNRKPYEQKPLEASERMFLLKDAARFSDCRFASVEERDAMREAAGELAHDGPINFGNKTLHALAFKEIVWTREAEAAQGGLYAPALEIDAKQEKIVKAIGKRPVAVIFKTLGMFSRVYKVNVERAASSALVGALNVADSDEAFLNAGRTLQNIWLRATSLGLSLHVMAGLVFLWQYENLGTKRILSADEKNTVNTAYTKLKKLFGTEDKELIGIAFRVGRGLPPLAYSLKKPPSVTAGKP